MRRLVAVLTLVFAAGCSETTSAPKPSPALQLTGRVVDRANIIDDETEIQLSARLAKLERETGAQFVIATTPSLAGRPIAAYSLDLARAWALGSSERNDGLLLLVAPAERQVRIEVGKGLERVIRDEICARIIRDRMIPLFRSGRAQEAILAGTGTILAVMSHATPARKAA